MTDLRLARMDLRLNERLTSLDRRSALRRLGGVGGALALPGLAGCAGRSASEGDGAAIVAGREVEADEAGLRAQMDRVEENVKRSSNRLSDGGLEQYASRIACRLAGDRCREIRVYVLRAPYFNVTLAPNGMMQIWSGALLRMDNEAQLAAVMAHEIAHYTQNHSIDNWRRVKSNAAIATFFGFGLGAVGVGGLTSIGQLASLADILAFSDEQMLEADAIGLEALTNAGYDAQQALALWENLVAERDADPEFTDREVFLRTHPASDERRMKLVEAVKALPEGGVVGRGEFLAATQAYRARLFDDEIALRQPDRTLVVLDRLQRLEPDAADLWRYRGDIWRLRDVDSDADAAIEAYREAIARDPDDAAAWRGIGLVERRRGRDDDARAAFAQYLQLEPEAPDAAFLRRYVDSA